MYRKVIVTLAAATTLLAQTPPKKAIAANQPTPPKAAAGLDKPALDKPKLEAYLRHLFVWPPPIEMTISDPTPGPMAGFYEIHVRGSQGNASQEETFYVSLDGQKIIRGTVFDLNQNPFKHELDQIKTAIPAEHRHSRGAGRSGRVQ